MVFQALSPSFWGPLSDLWGRRPIYLATLTIFIAFCAGLAVAPTFPALLALRMFQAFGASSGIALGAGVIGDITTPADIFTSCAMSSTAIGPVIGGVIAQKLSWRWIFWVLLVMGAIGLFTVLFFLPETLRSLVGNGSIYANPTPSQWLKRRLSKDPSLLESSATKSQRSHRIPNFLDAYLVLRHPDVILIMTINGCYMAILFTILTSTSTHFSIIYGLDTLQIGLCYIPYGVGSVCGSFMMGRMLDRDFRITAYKHGMSPEEVKRSGKLSTDFPIYRARLRTTWIQMTICQLVIIAYGWTLYVEAHLAVPLILQFIIGLSVASVMNACQALVIDLFPGKGASITATSNIVRSLLGAVATATIEVGIQSVGLGWMFTIIGLILVTNTAFIPILIKHGPKWWRKRREQQDKKR
ncbi:major facilitator superfamily domain-containing protein [Zychaea mexicana]|uniref:major facilitator superfamily domain-containing protein n=1 Tax=Zychaea mexicana TaxID=64656 RepID=UPI0022FF117B|nr:major facilitator superfamily domain-containing protein [Zychaea mexicana]KAI9479606.1 major facilitator superfamily domain-containing protein [Zychaea mexicana]